jgi:hypothetical protein
LLIAASQFSALPADPAIPALGTFDDGGALVLGHSRQHSAKRSIEIRDSCTQALHPNNLKPFPFKD